jgi:hypothetical protein
MNQDEIERALRGLRRARASRGLEARMGALFEGAARRTAWISPLCFPVPAWALAAACLLSAAAGFLASGIRRSAHPSAVSPTAIAICMLDPDRTLARRFLGTGASQSAGRLSDYRITVHSSENKKGK